MIPREKGGGREAKRAKPLHFEIILFYSPWNFGEKERVT
jgi:hypothetical protein